MIINAKNTTPIRIVVCFLLPIHNKLALKEYSCEFKLNKLQSLLDTYVSLQNILHKISPPSQNLTTFFNERYLLGTENIYHALSAPYQTVRFENG